MVSVHLSPPSSSRHMADLLCTIIVLCQASDERGDPFWSYLCLKPSMVQAFREARLKGSCNLDDFGTIIEHGKGNAVPLDVKLRMERDFGVNHRLEDDLAKAIEARKQIQ